MAQTVELYDKGGKSLTAQMYEGHIFPKHNLPDFGENIQALRNMPSRSDDILITTFPKSGTHWLMEATHMLLNKTTDYLRRDMPSSTGEVDGALVLEHIIISKLENLKSPRLMGTFNRPKNIPKDFKGRMIHLTRNPKDVAVSYYHFVRNLKTVDYDGKWDDFIHLYAEEGNVIYGPPFVYLREWRAFLQEHPEYNVLHVSYEDLHQDFISVLRRISSFLDLDEDANLFRQIQQKCRIEEIRKSRNIQPDAHREEYAIEKEDKDAPHFIFRKGIVGDWKNWFTVAQSEMFDRAYEKEMNS